MLVTLAQRVPRAAGSEPAPPGYQIAPADQVRGLLPGAGCRGRSGIELVAVGQNQQRHRFRRPVGNQNQTHGRASFLKNFCFSLAELLDVDNLPGGRICALQRHLRQARQNIGV